MKTQSPFDVFLCHNSEDKEAVIKIAEQLKDEYNIEPWLDEWELRPGFPWQQELEKQIAHIKSAAVFVGNSGIGPWQEDEINAFLREFKQRQCPVIPVLLPDAPQKPILPVFLRGITWVDFRQQMRVYIAPMDKLVWGITGNKPQPIVKVIPQSQTQNTPQNQTEDLDDEISPLVLDDERDPDERDPLEEEIARFQNTPQNQTEDLDHERDPIDLDHERDPIEDLDDERSPI